MSRRVRRGTSLSSPKATRDYLTLKLGTLEREVFAVIFLDKRHRVISYQEMFQGTIDGAHYIWLCACQQRSNACKCSVFLFVR